MHTLFISWPHTWSLSSQLASLSLFTLPAVPVTLLNPNPKSLAFSPPPLPQGSEGAPSSAASRSVRNEEQVRVNVPLMGPAPPPADPAAEMAPGESYMDFVHRVLK